MAKKADTEEKDTKPADEVEAVTAKSEAKADKPKKVTAKAGKRSAKALKEADDEAAKEERKAKKDTSEVVADETKRGPVPKTRPLIERRSKRYKAAHKEVKAKEYDLKSAIALAVSSSKVKFDASVELHMNLGVDPKQADQNIRGSVVLPHGTGKEQRVAVFAPTDMHADAIKAGADFAGEDDLIEQLKKEELNFDILIATPQLMGQLGRFAKLLGPKGLMPNPKSGTVTKNVVQAVKEAKAGRLEYRVDSYGIIHRPIGKVSFGADKLAENAQTVIDAVNNARPASVKGTYVGNVFINATMGPSIAVKL